MSRAVPPLGQALSLDDAEALFSAVLGGAYQPDQISEILIALAQRGESAAEIAGAARAMRQRMVPLFDAPGVDAHGADIVNRAIDVCGTGGDGSHSLNVSTAVSLVIAACDVPVAKHGNRAASSKAGAADTLEALGIRLDRSPEENSALLSDLGIAFLFAPAHHPALASVAPIRKKLGRRTIFNLLGPLCNPARVRRQLIGVAHPDLVPVYAEAAQMLGYDRLMIVSGMEGLDEISIAGPTLIRTLEDGVIHESVFDPQAYGLSLSPLSAIRGGDAEYNAAALRRLLMGERSAYRNAVLVNCAAALQVAGEVQSWSDGLEEAEEALDKGLAHALLNCWIAA